MMIGINRREQTMKYIFAFLFGLALVGLGYIKGREHIRPALMRCADLQSEAMAVVDFARQCQTNADEAIKQAGIQVDRLEKRCSGPDFSAGLTIGFMTYKLFPEPMTFATWSIRASNLWYVLEVEKGTNLTHLHEAFPLPKTNL